MFVRNNKSKAPELLWFGFNMKTTKARYYARIRLPYGGKMKRFLTMVFLGDVVFNNKYKLRLTKKSKRERDIRH